MSEISALFRKNLDRTPIPNKRFLKDESSSGKKKPYQRRKAPSKSIPEHMIKQNTKPYFFNFKELAKRTVSKQVLKKELKFYNQQLLLVLFRKIFFILVGVILFNLAVTSAHQIMILSNTLLALLSLDLNLGYDFLAYRLVKVGKLLLQILTYCLNYHLLFSQLHGSDEAFDEVSRLQVWILAVNAAINYGILTLCQPLIFLNGVKNSKQPYMSLFAKIYEQIRQFFQSFLTIYHLLRPILLFNLSYALLVILFIMKNQKEEVFEHLFTFSVFRSILMTTILLYCLLYFVRKVNSGMCIELISPNKKEISLSLLRLENENPNNQAIHEEILKYIWNNCQNFWDTQFLSHNYIINYDVLEDYLFRQFEDLLVSIGRINRFYEVENVSSFKNIDKPKNKSWVNLKKKVRQIGFLIEMGMKIQSKAKMFFIMQQITFFKGLQAQNPLHLQRFYKQLQKIQQAMSQMLFHINTYEMKMCFNNFYFYLHNNSYNS